MVTPHAVFQMPYDAQRDLGAGGEAGERAAGIRARADVERALVARLRWHGSRPIRTRRSSPHVRAAWATWVRRCAGDDQHGTHRACGLQGLGPVQRQVMGGFVCRRYRRHRRHLRLPSPRQAAYRRDQRRATLAHARRATFKELDVPMQMLALLAGVFAAAMPAAIVELLGRELVAIVGARTTERFVNLGLDRRPPGPKAAVETLAADYARAGGRSCNKPASSSIEFFQGIRSAASLGDPGAVPLHVAARQISFAGGYPSADLLAAEGLHAAMERAMQEAPAKWLRCPRPRGPRPRAGARGLDGRRGIDGGARSHSGDHRLGTGPRPAAARTDRPGDDPGGTRGYTTALTTMPFREWARA